MLRLNPLFHLIIREDYRRYKLPIAQLSEHSTSGLLRWAETITKVWWALEIVEAAARAGAHAIKLQTYTADTMTLKCDMAASRSTTLIHYGQAEICMTLQMAHTPWEWHAPIMNVWMGFNMPAHLWWNSDFLEDLNVPPTKLRLKIIISH